MDQIKLIGKKTSKMFFFTQNAVLADKFIHFAQAGCSFLTVALAASVITIAPEGVAFAVGAIGRAARAIGANINGTGRVPEYRSG
uniref:Uncharacterized protein n=1 Tax=Romanomermis culicivorax TaxID=13658 RepID=A0A915KLP0_ROMCU